MRSLWFQLFTCFLTLFGAGVTGSQGLAGLAKGPEGEVGGSARAVSLLTSALGGSVKFEPPLSTDPLGVPSAAAVSSLFPVSAADFDICGQNVFVIFAGYSRRFQHAMSSPTKAGKKTSLASSTS